MLDQSDENEETSRHRATRADSFNRRNSFWPGEVSGQSTSDKRTSASVIYEAVAATNATLWLMEDARLFEKYGLNAKVIHARGAVPVQALVSNSVEFGAFGGPSAVAAVLAGSDLVFIAAKGNFAVMPIWVGKDSPIKGIAGLKGKTLGVTRAGSATHTIARLALRSGGIADNEVRYLHHPGLRNLLFH